MELNYLMLSIKLNIYLLINNLVDTSKLGESEVIFGVIGVLKLLSGK